MSRRAIPSPSTCSASGETPYWRLFDGYGRQVWAGAVAGGPQVLAGAPSAGSYTLAIEGRVGATTPAVVSFEIDKGQPVAAPAAGTAITLGALVTGSLTTSAPLRYSFDLTSATKLYFDPVSWGNGTTWTLTGPRGTEFLDNPFNSLASTNHVFDLVAGSYTLALKTSNFSYQSSFRVLDMAAATALTFNQTTTIPAPTFASTMLYKFDATAGEHLYFDYLNYNGGFSSTTAWTVFDSYGRQVATNLFNGSDLEIASMPITGTYTLAIQGLTGSGSFAAYRRAVPIRR